LCLFLSPLLLISVSKSAIFVVQIRSVVVGGEGRSKKGAKERGNRACFRTREVMSFDPKTSVLRSQKKVDAYLVKYGICPSSNIQVEWCPVDTDFTMAAPCRRSIPSSPDLGIGVEASFNELSQSCVTLRFAPHVVGGGLVHHSGLRSLVCFFCPQLVPSEDFCAIYSMRKTNQGDRFFIPQSGCDKLIVNLVDIDHGWRDFVIRVSEP